MKCMICWYTDKRMLTPDVTNSISLQQLKMNES